MWNRAVTTGDRCCGGMRRGSERFSRVERGHTTGPLIHPGLARVGNGSRNEGVGSGSNAINATSACFIRGEGGGGEMLVWQR